MLVTLGSKACETDLVAELAEPQEVKLGTANEMDQIQAHQSGEEVTRQAKPQEENLGTACPQDEEIDQAEPQVEKPGTAKHNGGAQILAETSAGTTMSDRKPT